VRSGPLIAAVAGLFALGAVNFSILQKESLLREGEVVYLALAPVDPRSLMQGDYMALRFGVAGEIERAGPAARDGQVVVALDERSVGRFARLHQGEPLGADERVLAFRVRHGEVRFASNAFFFQEGTADRYAQARYGEFRVGRDGELLLTALRDAQLHRLGPAPG
jgi:uncharacterized membrane-anchored protein